LIEVVRAAGLATVQDGGRHGHMHEGVPPGGALVPELLALANAAARNGRETAAIELAGAITLRAHAPLLVATDQGDARVLQAGEAWDVTSGKARVGYVAIRGGIDVPRVLGGRGTLLVAEFGGFQGRTLRPGDRLAVADAPPCDEPVLTVADVPDPGALIAVVLGPDLDRFAPDAVDRLLAGTFAVDARSDRIGTRLVGPPLARLDADDGLSAPMVRGAIQVPASGQPIVLGPDHPTTGGYPVIATVVRESIGALGARPVGAPVRFVTASFRGA
jgi:5-oxoprolinase (ATP-hydrolysing) subunit C